MSAGIDDIAALVQVVQVGFSGLPSKANCSISMPGSELLAQRLYLGSDGARFSATSFSSG